MEEEDKRERREKTSVVQSNRTVQKKQAVDPIISANPKINSLRAHRKRFEMLKIDHAGVRHAIAELIRKRNRPTREQAFPALFDTTTSNTKDRADL